jgi:glycosyl transferase family 87
VTGAFALAAGGVLLAAGSLRVAAQLAPRSTASFLLGAYVVAWAQLVAVLWVLSLFSWVTRWALLAGLALVCVAILVDRRGWKDVVARLRDGASALRRALDEPLCAVLGVAVLAAFGYALALGLATPQNDFDTVFDHLWRAALWRENQAVGYPACDCAPYVNAYPPHGEMGVLATMVLGGSDRFAALVQAAAFVALAVGVVGVARGLGLARREALLGALLVATLPVIALQASTAQNDLVVASFLVAAAAFLLDTGPGAPWLAGGATALAIGTKVSAVFGLPVLVVVALAAAPSRRGQRLAGVLVGGAVGAYWYVVNWAEGGSWDAGFPYEAVDRGVADTVARALRSAIQLIELPGGGGRDRWLYLVAAAILFVGLAVAYRRRSAVTAVGSGAAAALVAVLPVLTPDVRRYADQAYLELWRAIGRDDLAVDVGRDITRSASNVTWYGPLGALLIVAGIVLAVIAARRGIVPWLGALLALAPVYWLVVMSAALFYQDAAGRFLMAPVALAGSMWGIVGRQRAIAWGLTGIAVTALGVALLNDTKRPSGLALLERPSPPSYWTAPRWRAVGSEVHVPALIRFVDGRVPDDARVALAITASDPGYVLLGHGLRPFSLLAAGARDAPGASWAFVSPGARGSAAPRLCGAWERQGESPGGWDAYRRVRPRC